MHFVVGSSCKATSQTALTGLHEKMITRVAEIEYAETKLITM
jgi:hypothetical protein